jgi:hypothetical protein
MLQHQRPFAGGAALVVGAAEEGAEGARLRRHRVHAQAVDDEKAPEGHAEQEIGLHLDQIA